MEQRIMKLALVEDMVTNYKTKQYLSIVTNTVNPMKFDAQSAWFDLQSLKKLIAAIETETAKHPEFKMHNFGLRFYYSAYPESKSWDNPDLEGLGKVPESYEKLHTLVAIPTAEMNGVNSDFDPYDVKTYTGNKPSDSGTMIMAENHGKLTPPGSGTGLWF